MRRVLIVSPHFPPVNAPDMQRVRLALPYLRQFGWEPTVLAVMPESVEGAVIERLLEQTYPSDVHVIRVKGWNPHALRRLGFGSLWWRCGRALRRAGDALLAREKFDLVFFSTTQFDAFTLGPRWRKRFGVPFVLDYQDPWVNDYYRENGVRPPGGRFKFWVSQFTARLREPAVLKSAAGVIAVSSAYVSALQRRYPWFSATTVHTLPFGTSCLDLEIARTHRPDRSLVPFDDGNIHHVYAGRCGLDMEIALTVLFKAFDRYLHSHPEKARRHRFHFIGTDYAPPPLGRHQVLPVAERENVQAYVAEHCYRVPYFDALHYLTRADALIVVGSDDPTYNASKIFPYLLTRRPLMVITHEQSPMATLLHEKGQAICYGFNEHSDLSSLVDKLHQSWFVDEGFLRPPEFNHQSIADNLAESMTARLAAVFASATRSSTQLSAARHEPRSL